MFSTCLYSFPHWQSSTFEAKSVYLEFLNQCYLETEVEVKDVYTSSYMWALFADFANLVSKV